MDRIIFNSTVMESRRLGELWQGSGRGLRWGGHQVEKTPEGNAGSLYFVTRAKNTAVYRIIPFV